MTQVLRTDENPSLDGRELPDFRPVSKAEENEPSWMNWGSICGVNLASGPGPIAEVERMRVYEDIVAFYYRKLRELARSLRPEETLPFLVAQHEANTYAMVHRQLTIPSRLACFATEEELLKELSKEIPEVQKANLVSRFIVG